MRLIYQFTFNRQTTVIKEFWAINDFLEYIAENGHEITEMFRLENIQEPVQYNTGQTFLNE